MTRNFPYLTHPIVLLALLLTFVNDHYLKFAFPGLLTGKISDFAGLFFFPLFICAIVELLKSPDKVHSTLSKKSLVAAIVVTDVLFIVLKYTDLREHFQKLFSQQLFAIQITADPTDLLALSVNFLTYKFAKKFFIQSLSG